MPVRQASKQYTEHYISVGSRTKQIVIEMLVILSFQRYQQPARLRTYSVNLVVAWSSVADGRRAS